MRQASGVRRQASGVRRQASGVRRQASRCHRYIEIVPAPTVCDVCGFSWESADRSVISPRLLAATETFAEVIVAAGDLVALRPSAERWSILEYGGHLRDVMISIRERIMLAAIVDAPTGVAMNREERIARGFYHLDTADEVVAELSMLTRLFLKTVASLDADDFARTLTYSGATPYQVTIGWAAAQAVHEAEHHLRDAQDNLSSLL